MCVQGVTGVFKVNHFTLNTLKALILLGLKGVVFKVFKVFKVISTFREKIRKKNNEKYIIKNIIYSSIGFYLEHLEHLEQDVPESLDFTGCSRCSR